MAMSNPVIKHVSTSGQVSLGKEYAGKHILMSKLADGTIVIKLGSFIPQGEQWLYANDPNLTEFNKILDEAEGRERIDNFKQIVQMIEI